MVTDQPLREVVGRHAPAGVGEPANGRRGYELGASSKEIPLEQNERGRPAPLHPGKYGSSGVPCTHHGSLLTGGGVVSVGKNGCLKPQQPKLPQNYRTLGPEGRPLVQQGASNSRPLAQYPLGGNVGGPAHNGSAYGNGALMSLTTQQRLQKETAALKALHAARGGSMPMSTYPGMYGQHSSFPYGASGNLYPTIERVGMAPIHTPTGSLTAQIPTYMHPHSRPPGVTLASPPRSAATSQMFVSTSVSEGSKQVPMIHKSSKAPVSAGNPLVDYNYKRLMQKQISTQQAQEALLPVNQPSTNPNGRAMTSTPIPATSNIVVAQQQSLKAPQSSLLEMQKAREQAVLRQAHMASSAALGAVMKNLPTAATPSYLQAHAALQAQRIMNIHTLRPHIQGMTGIPAGGQAYMGPMNSSAYMMPGPLMAPQIPGMAGMGMATAPVVSAAAGNKSRLTGGASDSAKPTLRKVRSVRTTAPNAGVAKAIQVVQWLANANKRMAVQSWHIPHFPGQITQEVKTLAIKFASSQGINVNLLCSHALVQNGKIDQASTGAHTAALDPCPQMMSCGTGSLPLGMGAMGVDAAGRAIPGMGTDTYTAAQDLTRSTMTPATIQQKPKDSEISTTSPQVIDLDADKKDIQQKKDEKEVKEFGETKSETGNVTAGDIKAEESTEAKEAAEAPKEDKVTGEEAENEEPEKALETAVVGTVKNEQNSSGIGDPTDLDAAYSNTDITHGGSECPE